jgi:pimeloyl-ACP methyl ester carboxylesterase
VFTLFLVSLLPATTLAQTPSRDSTAIRPDVYRPPETWAKRAYPNLIYFHEVDKGGHLAAWKQPELFSSELRAAFRSLRSSL